MDFMDAHSASTQAKLLLINKMVMVMSIYSLTFNRILRVLEELIRVAYNMLKKQQHNIL